MTFVNKPKLIICGSIAIDRIMNFSGRYKDLIKPEMIHVLSISFFLDKVVTSHGGVGADIAYTLALLGEKPVLMGSVGPDADEYLEKLSKCGVDVEHVHRSEDATACFNVFTDSEDNQVGGFYPGAMFDSATLSFEKWKEEDAFFVVSPHDPGAMRQQTEECKKFGLRMFYDIGQQVVTVPTEDLIAGIDAAELLVLNDYEFATLSERTGKSPEEIKKQVPVVIVTKGKSGATIEGKNVEEKIEIPVAKPKLVADPTGAGDAFRAGFLYGYIRDVDLETCGKMGAVSSVYAVENHGTQEFTFTKKEFDKRFEENFKESLISLK